MSRSGHGLHDALCTYEASGRMLSRVAPPDKTKKKKHANGLYKRLTEAARKGFISLYKSDSRDRGLIFDPNTVPVAIGSLGPCRAERLKFLGLSRCQLRLLPDFVSNLVNLESLQLHHNHLKTLPDWIGNLTQLKYLDVSGNLLRYLPDSVGKCSSLLELDANLNQLESLPSTFGDLEKLEKVHIHINNLRSLPASCSELKSLRYIDLRFNKLQELPLSIGDLQPIDFQGCDTEGLPEFIDVSCSKTSEAAGNEPQAFSAKITMYNYLKDSNHENSKEPSKCFDGQLNNMSIIVLLDGNPVIVPPMTSLYVTCGATLERFTDEALRLVDSELKEK